MRLAERGHVDGLGDQTGNLVLGVGDVRHLEIAGLEAIARCDTGHEDVLGDRPLGEADLLAPDLAHAVDVGALEHHQVGGRADHGVDGDRGVGHALVEADQEGRGGGRVDVDGPGDHRVASLLAEEELPGLHVQPRLLEVSLADGDDVGGAHDRRMHTDPELERLRLRSGRLRQSEKASHDSEHSEHDGGFHGHPPARPGRARTWRTLAGQEKHCQGAPMGGTHSRWLQSAGPPRPRGCHLALSARSSYGAE